MARREKPKAKTYRDEEDEDDDVENPRINHAAAAAVVSDSDDDAAANEDLTLKIIEKAMKRASHASSAAVDGGGEEEVVVGVNSEGVKKKKAKKGKKKKKQKSVKDIDSEFLQSVPTTEAKEVGDASIDAEVVDLPEASAVEDSNPENVVLRRLLRGPRYFDPPDKSWGACFNCGEEGHSAVNCTSARRKRPCFICGSLEHEVKQCQKGQDCFICKGQGHRARDCPEKMKRCSKASEFCLKCGASAHVMFTCNNDYSHDDLKDIQCYVCKRFGHLCCANYSGALVSEASCYKCGLTGHNGQDCRSSKGEPPAGATPSTCYKCGEEGHFARECQTSGKAKKRTRDLSSPAEKYPRDKKGKKGYKSAPQEFGKSRRKKLHYDDESPNWSSKPKRRGGWIQDDSDDYPHGWRSPATPKKHHRIFDLTAGGQGSSPQYYRKNSNFSPGSSSSRGYGMANEHRYTASRFGHPTHSTDSRRNYNWW